MVYNGFSSRLLSILGALLAFALSTAILATAAATEESELSCQPTEVEINQPVTCYVYVRDSLQEPTTNFKLSDFSIRVVGEEADATPAFSAMVISDDPTVAKFTVTSNKGTVFRIDVVIKSTGLYIRNSGVTATALTWPASDLGTITCDKNVLSLRSSTICTVPLFGDNGVPATVHASDVFFSEDHAAGKFAFISGVRQLVFNYTAPASLLAALESFTLRVTLSAASRVYSHTIPMSFPTMPPSERSLLRCADGGHSSSSYTCFVSAADNYGPVAFDGSKFTVTFERIVDGEWTDITDKVYSSFSPSTSATGSLSFSPKLDNEIYTARMHVFAAGREVLSSPFSFQMGVPPAWSQMTFRSCSSVYVTPHNTTTCVIDVASGVTADPSYVAIGSRLGGKIVGPMYSKEGNNSILTFTYTPPGVGSRVEEFLTATTGGVNIVSSPYRIIVYPDATKETLVDTNAHRPTQIAIGVVFYGAILAVGSAVLFKRNRQAARVKAYRAQHSEVEEERAVRTPTSKFAPSQFRSMEPIITRNLHGHSSTTTSFGEADAPSRLPSDPKPREAEGEADSHPLRPPLSETAPASSLTGPSNPLDRTQTAVTSK